MTETTEPASFDLFFAKFAESQHQHDGIFSATLSRAVANRLIEQGYTTVPGDSNAVPADADDLFEAIANVEHEHTGMFTAPVVRRAARAIAEEAFKA